MPFSGMSRYVKEEGMRKRLKKKLKSCGLCKPHKTGQALRWTDREEARLREFERDRQRALRR
ncbi:MAG: hypothetical protein JF888_02970 [Candidatus Dormibacteraeota bacterium]|uniref:Uncharacterized protein n=1 Tax=Candidatus Dormiibacter inghamiae TaxID=3127013 RepID=A0A934KEG4_9BACT|nr:hypothetical protein [Candidatus Dormibacteraeota bacterium]